MLSPGATHGLPVVREQDHHASDAPPKFDGDGPFQVCAVLEGVDVAMDAAKTGCNGQLCSVRFSVFGKPASECL